MTEGIRSKLVALYGADVGETTYQRLLTLLGEPSNNTPRPFPFSERDVILICYGDQVRRQGEAPLDTLRQFLSRSIKPYINTVHILPFYPYSSDDGFSVIDYEAVDPNLGTWQDILALKDDFRLMFDAVINHVSAQSAWFERFLRDESPYNDYFISVDPSLDLSLVRRPRTHPLLTRFETAAGEKYVWTTFSEDQIDLNFANPDVLLEILHILLLYVQRGASLIRLDAIAYLWKTIGTSCIHLPQTHLVVQLIRDVLDVVAPHIALITETNVPHDENISYYGDGGNEAQMVYQFSLPPLILHSFRVGNAEALSAWAKTLPPSNGMTGFFNFTASHDGIGVTPLRGLVDDGDINALCERVVEHGGFVSYKNNSDGSRSPYELNITYFDVITPPALTERDPAGAVQRFICSQAIMLAVMGVPGVYFNSLFGGRNDLAGYEETGRYRSINREKPLIDELEAGLGDAASIRQRVYAAYCHLLAIRTAQPAFHPLAAQRILDVHPHVFAVERLSRNGAERIIALHNVGDAPVTLTLDLASRRDWTELLTNTNITSGEAGLQIALQPYAVAWLREHR
jgi:sucrose phosphorylase